MPSDLGFWTDEVLISAAKLIREYHDATTQFLEQSEVICHNDLSPCNTVLQQGMPIAFTNFDAATPGKRSDDLAYAIWLWCDLGNDEISAIDQSHRIQLFCNSYGLKKLNLMIDSIINIQKIQIEKYQLNINQGSPEWKNAVS